MSQGVVTPGITPGCLCEVCSSNRMEAFDLLISRTFVSRGCFITTFRDARDVTQYRTLVSNGTEIQNFESLTLDQAIETHLGALIRQVGS